MQKKENCSACTNKTSTKTLHHIKPVIDYNTFAMSCDTYKPVGEKGVEITNKEF